MMTAATQQREAAYAAVLETPRKCVDLDLDPADLIKLIRRVRRVSFFLRVNVPLVTERVSEESVRAYDPCESIRVSAAQAIDLLERHVEFNQRKAEHGEPAGRIPVARVGDFLFIG